jgi:phosphoadenosine phosphosulfate reductase
VLFLHGDYDMKKIDKENERTAKDMIRSVLEKSKNPCVFFSGGKNSLVLLNYSKEYGPQDLSVIYVDTGLEFPEVQSYMEKIKKLWKLNLIIIKPEEEFNEHAKKNECSCEHQKKEIFLRILLQKKYDCILIGDTSESHDSISTAESTHPDLISVIFKPLLSFTRSDIWDTIRTYNLPYCSLYDKGYQKIDCVSCSTKNQVTENTLIQDDEEIIKEKLKKLGYL